MTAGRNWPQISEFHALGEELKLLKLLDLTSGEYRGKLVELFVSATVFEGRLGTSVIIGKGDSIKHKFQSFNKKYNVYSNENTNILSSVEN